MLYRILRPANAAAVLLVAAALGLVLARYPAARVAAAGGLFLAYVYSRPPPRRTAYGAARWADPRDLGRELAPGNGLCVGDLLGARDSLTAGLRALFDPRVPARVAVPRFLASWRKGSRPPGRVRLNASVHTCVIAPTGAGKGVSIVIPYLLSSPDGMVVIDIKSENYGLTAAHRAKAFGHKIIVLDPFGVTGGASDTLDVLAGIDPAAPGAFDDLKAVVGVFADDPARAGTADPYWGRGGQDCVLVAAAFTLAHVPAGARNLQTVRDLLSSPARFRRMAAAAALSPAYDGMLARLAGQFAPPAGEAGGGGTGGRAEPQPAGTNPKELNTFLSVANRAMGVLDTPAVARNTASSTFDPAELFSHPKGLTAYLVLPPDKLNSHGNVLKLWLGAFFRACVANGLQERKLVRFILDEAASLKQMPEIEDAVQVYRGYGVRLTFILQNLAQVSRVVPPGQEATLLGNCTCVYFGVTDRKTAQELSDTCGKFTQEVAGGNAGWSRSRPDGGGDKGGGGGSSATSGGTSWSLAARELATASELMTADPRVAVTTAPGKPPILTRLPRYYEPGSATPGRFGPVRCAADTACLVLLALLAVLAGRDVTRNGGKNAPGKQAVARPVVGQVPVRPRPRVEAPGRDGGPGIEQGHPARAGRVRALPEGRR